MKPFQLQYILYKYNNKRDLDGLLWKWNPGTAWQKPIKLEIYSKLHCEFTWSYFDIWTYRNKLNKK